MTQEAKLKEAELIIKKAITARGKADSILVEILPLLGLDPYKGWGIQFTPDNGAEFFNTCADFDDLDTYTLNQLVDYGFVEIINQRGQG